MEKANSSAKGAKAIKGARVLIFLHVLILFGLSCEHLADGLDMYQSRFWQNVSVMLTTLTKLNLEPIILSIAYLIPFISVSVIALVLALIALLRYKNQEAKSWVAFGIVLIIATSLLVFGSPDPSFLPSPLSVSTEHNFEVQFPGQVKVTDYGAMTHYTSEIGGEAAYNIFVIEYPKPVLSDKAIQAELEGYLQGRLITFGDRVRLRQTREVLFLGHKALYYEYTVESDDTTGYFRGIFFVVGKLGYGISFVCTEETRTLAYAKYDDFVKSFRLIGGD